MDNILIYPVGFSNSCHYASDFLRRKGFPLTDHPMPEITHLLLDVPSSGKYDLENLLPMLPPDVTVIGGNLGPLPLNQHRRIDLLQNPYYLARNAAITAECALQAAAPYLHTTFADSPTLILGWGRIGKCLAKLLSACGCPVTVAARKAQDRAMLEALGYGAVDFTEIPPLISSCRLLFNTVPNLPVIWDLSHILAIDLASAPGLAGDSVIPARGLPGKYAPESSGRLIAETLSRFYLEGTL